MKTKKINLLLLIILIVNIVLRIPSLFEPVSYGDECIYLTLGNAFNKGLVFYRDIHDNKPPLLYVVAAIAGANLFWLRLITIIWNTLNAWLVYKIAKKLAKKESAGLLAAFLFALFSLLPEGRIANGEIYMIMPASLGLLLALDKRWFLSGLMFSLAFLFKIPVAFDFVGLLLAFFVFSKQKIKDIFFVIKDKNLWLALIGFILPIGLTIVYYRSKGAFTPYVRSALLQNVGYLSSWGGSSAGLYQRAAILLAVIGLIFVWRERLAFAFFIPATMLLFGLYGVFLSERPYPHYLIEVTPWAALLFAVLLSEKKIKQLIVTLILVFLTCFGFYKYEFWWYPHIPYYQNFLKYALGKISSRQYLNYFGQKTIDNYQIGQFISQNTENDQRVFVWGDAACIYAVSGRLPPGRYTVNYHIFDFDGFEETIKAVEDKKPNLIVKLPDEKRQFPKLDQLLKNDYKMIRNIKGALVYQKRQ